MHFKLSLFPSFAVEWKACEAGFTQRIALGFIFEQTWSYCIVSVEKKKKKTFCVHPNFGLHFPKIVNTLKWKQNLQM